MKNKLNFQEYLEQLVDGQLEYNEANQAKTIIMDIIKLAKKIGDPEEVLKEIAKIMSKYGDGGLAEKRASETLTQILRGGKK